MAGIKKQGILQYCADVSCAPTLRKRNLFEWLLKRPVGNRVQAHANAGDYDLKGMEIVALARYQTSNLGGKTIAKEFGVSRDVLRKMLADLGLTATPKPRRGGSGRPRDFNREYAVAWAKQLEREAKHAEASEFWGQHPDVVRAATRRKNQERYNANLEASRRASRETAARRYERLKHTPEWKMQQAARNTVSRIARMVGRRRKCRPRTVLLLGCSYDRARAHIESLFKPGMSWENHGVAWEIDHKKPISAFNLNALDEVKAAMHWTNLQPLWKAENREKSARWVEAL